MNNFDFFSLLFVLYHISFSLRKCFHRGGKRPSFNSVFVLSQVSGADNKKKTLDRQMERKIKAKRSKENETRKKAERRKKKVSRDNSGKKSYLCVFEENWICFLGLLVVIQWSSVFGPRSKSLFVAVFLECKRN